MTVKLFIGVDADGREWSYDTEHEASAAKEICKKIYLAHHKSKNFFAVVNNLHEPNTDMIIITERGVGIVELKHYYGKIFINQDGTWSAGEIKFEIKSGKYRDPHEQAQSYAKVVRNIFLSEIPNDLRSESPDLKFQTAVCFTHEDARIDDAKQKAKKFYKPKEPFEWESFSILKAEEVANWADSLRLEENTGRARRNRPYRLSPTQIGDLITKKLGAIEWHDLYSLMPTGQPYGYLKLIVEGQLLQTYTLSRDKAVIGRDVMCDIPIPQTFERVSRLHAEVTRLVTGQIWLEDKNSTHGTFVNGSKETITRIQLSPGSKIILGGSEPSSNSTCTLELSEVKPNIPPTK